MLDKTTKCSYCGNKIEVDDIEKCEICGEDMCSNCKEYRDYYFEYAHEDCNDNEDFCDGEEEYVDEDTCEQKYCYDKNCSKWGTENHFGQTKSEWDEEREFRASLDPNDPADAWFFED